MNEGLIDFEDTTLSVGALRACVLKPKQKKQKTEKVKKGRQVVWHPRPNQYVCIREGNYIVPNLVALDTHVPQESHFYLYKNTDANASRNPHVPLYEAAYQCADGTLVRVQKKHLKVAYAACGRKDVKRAWEMLEGGLPYWVDRFAFCRVK